MSDEAFLPKEHSGYVVRNAPAEFSKARTEAFISGGPDKLSREHLLELPRRFAQNMNLRGLPVDIAHENSLNAGKVTGQKWDPETGSMSVNFRLFSDPNTPGPNASRDIEAGHLKALSLTSLHKFHPKNPHDMTVVPEKVALTVRGARAGTDLVGTKEIEASMSASAPAIGQDGEVTYRVTATFAVMATETAPAAVDVAAANGSSPPAAAAAPAVPSPPQQQQPPVKQEPSSSSAPPSQPPPQPPVPTGPAVSYLPPYGRPVDQYQLGQFNGAAPHDVAHLLSMMRPWLSQPPPPPPPPVPAAAAAMDADTAIAWGDFLRQRKQSSQPPQPAAAAAAPAAAAAAVEEDQTGIDQIIARSNLSKKEKDKLREKLTGRKAMEEAYDKTLEKDMSANVKTQSNWQQFLEYQKTQKKTEEAKQQQRRSIPTSDGSTMVHSSAAAAAITETDGSAAESNLHWYRVAATHAPTRDGAERQTVVSACNGLREVVHHRPNGKTRKELQQEVRLTAAGVAFFMAEGEHVDDKDKYNPYVDRATGKVFLPPLVVQTLAAAQRDPASGMGGCVTLTASDGPRGTLSDGFSTSAREYDDAIYHGRFALPARW